MLMSKILQITDGKDIFDIECVEQIHTLVSETILQKFKDHENVIAKDVVLEVFLMISGINSNDWKNWTFSSNVLIS
jgi:hypothetical protein